jgi:ABC-type uncharacterized transport system ATPase subunit
MFKTFAKGSGVDQITVMAYRNCSKRAVHNDGLSIAFAAITRSGIPRVADGIVALELGESVFVIDVRDVAHGFMRKNLVTVGRGYPGAFLPPMLKSIQAEMRQRCGVGMICDSKDPAHRRISLSVVNHLG